MLGTLMKRKIYNEDILYTILPLTVFSLNYSKSHKSRLKFETKYDLCEIAQK